MKRVKILFAVALMCAMGTVGYNAYSDANMTVQERLIFANVEALTNTEIIYGAYCRCRNGECYPGSAISFRPLCAKFASSNPGSANCGLGDGNCK